MNFDLSGKFASCIGDAIMFSIGFGSLLAHMTRENYADIMAKKEKAAAQPVATPTRLVTSKLEHTLQ